MKDTYRRLYLERAYQANRVAAVTAPKVPVPW